MFSRDLTRAHPRPDRLRSHTSAASCLVRKSPVPCLGRIVYSYRRRQYRVYFRNRPYAPRAGSSTFTVTEITRAHPGSDHGRARLPPHFPSLPPFHPVLDLPPSPVPLQLFHIPPFPLHHSPPWAGHKKVTKKLWKSYKSYKKVILVTKKLHK